MVLSEMIGLKWFGARSKFGSVATGGSGFKAS